MEKLRYIICLLMGFIWTSCTKAPVFQESLVPEIVNITSIPEIHSAVLMSDLNAAPFGKVECGFYFGTDKTNLRRLPATLAGKSFALSLNDLDEGTTYYFKAFISNGVNEIGSGFESFLTDVEPIVPEQPSDPVPEDPVPENPEKPSDPAEPSDPQEPNDPEHPSDPEPENPAPEDPEPEDPADPSDPKNPDNPTDPENPEPESPEPENPENPGPEYPDDPTPENPEPEEPEHPAEFSVEITELKAEINDYIAELTAVLEGDVSLVTDCWFMVGYSPDKLSKIKGTLEGISVKAYLAGLESGTYHYKAVITNGTETKETEIHTFLF